MPAAASRIGDSVEQFDTDLDPVAVEVTPTLPNALLQRTSFDMRVTAAS